MGKRLTNVENIYIFWLIRTAVQKMATNLSPRRPSLVEISIRYNKENSKFLLKQISTGHQSDENRKDEQVPAKTDKHRTPV